MLSFPGLQCNHCVFCFRDWSQLNQLWCGARWARPYCRGIGRRRGKRRGRWRRGKGCWERKWTAEERIGFQSTSGSIEIRRAFGTAVLWIPRWQQLQLWPLCKRENREGQMKNTMGRMERWYVFFFFFTSLWCSLFCHSSCANSDKKENINSYISLLIIPFMKILTIVMPCLWWNGGRDWPRRAQKEYLLQYSIRYVT